MSYTITINEAQTLMFLNLFDTVNEIIYDFAVWAVGSNDFQKNLEILKDSLSKQFDTGSKGDDFVLSLNNNEIETLKVAFAIWNKLAIAIGSKNDAQELSRLLKITV